MQATVKEETKPVKSAILYGLAQLKWDEFDKDQNGWIDQDEEDILHTIPTKLALTLNFICEVSALAEWVWRSFRPGKEINPEELKAEGLKIMKRCDTNEDGRIDEKEFMTYYMSLTAQMETFKQRKGGANTRVGKAEVAKKTQNEARPKQEVDSEEGIEITVKSSAKLGNALGKNNVVTSGKKKERMLIDQAFKDSTCSGPAEVDKIPHVLNVYRSKYGANGGETGEKIKTWDVERSYINDYMPLQELVNAKPETDVDPAKNTNEWLESGVNSLSLSLLCASLQRKDGKDNPSLIPTSLWNKVLHEMTSNQYPRPQS